MVLNNKVGMGFTILAIILVSALVLANGAYKGFLKLDQAQVVERRVLSANNFFSDLNNDLERGFYIAAFRGLISLDQYITEVKHDYLDDVEYRFREVVLNGTVNETSMEIMENATFSAWMSRVQLIAAQQGYNLTFSDIELNVYHSSPWIVIANLSISVNLSDEKMVVSWFRSASTQQAISIIDFEDPVYAIGSQGALFNKIKRTPYTVLVDGENVTNLELHNHHSYYLENENAPSYLMRLGGDLGGSVYGIESMISINHLLGNGLNTTKSVIDFVYWSSEPISYYINGTSPLFMLDNESGRLALYHVQGIAYQ